MTFVVSAAAFSPGRDSSPAQGVDPRSAEAVIARAEARLRIDPDDGDALALYGTAALARMSETADSSWYVRADRALTRALRNDPGNVPALDAAATLANARHRFHAALRLATRSVRLAPDRLAPLDRLIDARVELGHYDRAFALVDRRLQARPDLASYSRASYAAELRGHRPLAARLMRLASVSARPGSAERTWALTQLAVLRLRDAGPDAAEPVLARALAETPGDAGALAVLGLVRAHQGRLDEAAAELRRSLDTSPVAPVAAHLAEVEWVRGDRHAARAALATARTLDDREQGNGVLLDLDAAAVDADFGRPTSRQVALARAGHRHRTGVVGDSALGWVLTRAGRCREGLGYARRSLRLGTDDGLMLFRAGVAARCAGRRADGDRLLRRALRVDPRFSLRWAPVARDLVAAGSGSGS